MKSGRREELDSLRIKKVEVIQFRAEKNKLKQYNSLKNQCTYFSQLLHGTELESSDHA
jgi:hypothetical protein